MNGICDSPILHQTKLFRFGNKGSSMAQSCMAEKTSGDGGAEAVGCVNSRILRAYFRKRAHSAVVGSLLKDCKVESSRKEKPYLVGVLTVHPQSLQTSLGRDLSNGANRSCVSHNVSNTGSSKILRQHARSTAASFSPDVISSQAMSLKISSTLRQGCIKSRRWV